MTPQTLLVFALTLYVAARISGVATRGVLSTAVLFLGVGFVSGSAVLGVAPISPTHPIVIALATLALVTTLFTDGMHAGIQEIAAVWRLPGRALLLGMPLTIAGIALLARGLVGLSWTDSLLLGAVLSPTDPVFAAAIIGQRDIPVPVRRLLNLESGLNDGLALPIIIVLLASYSGGIGQAIVSSLGSVAAGVAIGVTVPLLALIGVGGDKPALTQIYQPLLGFAIGAVVFAIALATGANEYLAAFAAGVTVVSANRPVSDEYTPFGKVVGELLKLGALLVFGALISPSLLLSRIDWSGYLFAALALLLVRPLALAVSLLGSRLGWREWLIAGWFGPKGFSSAIYALLILQSGIPQASLLFHLAAIVIAASVIAHSSTDDLMARWYRRETRRREARAHADQHSHAAARADPARAQDAGIEPRAPADARAGAAGDEPAGARSGDRGAGAGN